MSCSEQLPHSGRKKDAAEVSSQLADRELAGAEGVLKRHANFLVARASVKSKDSEVNEGEVASTCPLFFDAVEAAKGSLQMVELVLQEAFEVHGEQGERSKQPEMSEMWRERGESGSSRLLIGLGREL